MAFNWRKFPWTNLHDLNLDWIIQTVKTLEDNLTDAIGKFTEIVNTAVGAEREERIAKDAEIQAEIVTEVYPAISKSITDTITGSGDLSIDKTGAVNISGNGVKIEDKRSGGLVQILKGVTIGCQGTFAEIVNTTANKTLILVYNGILQILDNNHKPVSIYGVDTVNKAQTAAEARKNLAASCGYVDGEITEVNSALELERGERLASVQAVRNDTDVAIAEERRQRESFEQTVDDNIICNINVSVDGDFTGGNTTLDSTVISQLKAALSINRLVSLTLKNFTVASNLYQTRYLLLDNYASPPSANGEYTATFYNVGKTISATIDTATGVLTYNAL